MKIWSLSISGDFKTKSEVSKTAQVNTLIIDLFKIAWVWKFEGGWNTSLPPNSPGSYISDMLLLSVLFPTFFLICSFI